jgi:hypothetical protein
MEAIMFRKLALGVIAAMSLSAAALAPSAASAHGWGGWHGGWHGGGFGHHSLGFVGPTFYVGGDTGCYEKQIVQTRRGPRVRFVNVCMMY